jgi:ABC-type multidrug transport system fused ATPase/permease subunit
VLAVIEKQGEDMSSRRRRRARRESNTLTIILAIILYIIVAVIFLKLFRIIPDPPEFDINVVIGLLAFATTLLTTFSTWLSKRFSDINESIDTLNENVRELSTSFKVLTERTNSIQNNLAFHERLVRLEERGKEKEK